MQAWSAVGTARFSAGKAEDISLALHPTTGAPYVAYKDFGNSSKVTVQTFSGGAWSVVGSARFSSFTTTYMSLAFHPTTSAPYVAYKNGNSGNTTAKAVVQTFSGGAWSVVGPADGLSAGQADYISLAFHPTTGAPFVSYRDASTSPQYKATVQTFSGGAWSVVGSAGFSAGIAQFTSLAFHPTTGAPYVVYQDASATPFKATLMTFG